MKTNIFETGISDHHKIISTIMKLHFTRGSPKTKYHGENNSRFMTKTLKAIMTRSRLKNVFIKLDLTKTGYSTKDTETYARNS